jgi:hypothetical protein
LQRGTQTTCATVELGIRTLNLKPPYKLSVIQSTLLVLVMLATPLILDQLIFRGGYLLFVEPRSTAGMTLLARKVQESEYVSGMKNVLIIGDSRIAEGFSSKIANEVGRAQGFNFVSISLYGTSPRVWYYFLRDIDPHRNRFHAIYLMARTLRDDDVYDDATNQTADTAYLAPLLTWRDMFSYPATFSDPNKIRKAYISIAFPSSLFKEDLMEFIQAPKTRLKKVRQWNAGYPYWVSTYSGHSESLPTVDEPFTPDQVLARLDGDRKNELADYFNWNRDGTHQPNDNAFAYRTKWYGSIAGQYSSTGVTVGVFLIPRGPYSRVVEKTPEPEGALKILRDKGIIRLVDPAVTVPLEKPEYFFDHMHMNTAGRTVFSRSFAETIVNQLKN